MPEATDEAPQKKPVLGLSLTQLIGSSAAAATAAVLGARLGTTGTIIGAALVSLVTAVASALYQASIRRTQEVVARTKELLPTNLPTMRTRAPLPEIAEEVTHEQVAEATPSLWSRVGWKSVAAAAGAVFVITALVITGFELVSGRSIEGGGRTTVNNAFHGGSHATPTPTPTPSGGPTPSKDPSSSNGPSRSATPSPSESSTPSSTPTSTASPSAEPTPTASPTASPSASATR